MRLPQFVSIALAGSLLMLGIPQAADSAWKLWTDEWPALVGSHPSTAIADILRDVTALEGADEWFDDPVARVRAGVLMLAIADRQNSLSPIVAQVTLRRVVDDLSSGLERAPADSGGWASLAYAQNAIGQVKAAEKALRTSYLLGHHETYISALRSRLGLQLYERLDDDEQALVDDDIRAAWEKYPLDLAQFARSDGRYNSIILRALASDPSSVAGFEKAIKKSP